MMLLFSPWFWLAAIVAAAGIWTHGYTSNDGADKVTAEWNKANVVAEGARQVRVSAVRAQEKALREQADDARRKQDEDSKLRDGRLHAALDELRKRPSRPVVGVVQRDVHPGTAAPAGEGGGCTGARLFAEDGAFLVRFADLAQRVRNQRDACYSAYEAAQRALAGQPGPQPGK